MPADKVKYGFKSCYYAVQTVSSLGVVSYGTPVALPGAKSISLAPKGDKTVFYADNIEYYSCQNNNGYEGDLELALIPDAFRQDVLNEVLDTKQVLVESVTNEPKKFALGFEITGDANNTRFWFYNCSVARPEAGASTKEESVDPQTEKLSISCTASTNGYVRVKTISTTVSTAYDGWFSTVYQPTM